jgi:hypothetical protein
VTNPSSSIDDCSIECCIILAFEGDSHVEWLEGNFQDYEEDKKRRVGDAAVEPHRIKFKRFERR